MNKSMMPDEPMARTLLKEIGIDTRKGHIVPVTGGTVNHAYRIERGDDDPLIMRIAPTDAEAEAGPAWMTSHGLRREQNALRFYESIDHLLPKTIHFDDSRSLIDRDWVVQTWIPGQTWIDARPNLTLEQELDLWRNLGRLARQLHSVVGEEFGPPEVGMGHTTWSEMIRWDVTRFLVDSRRYELDTEIFQDLCALVDNAVSVLDQVKEPRLVHSDLGLHHVFLSTTADGRYQISGIIDMEFARFADPYSETVFVEQQLMPSDDGRDVALCEGYECEPPTHDSQLRMQIYELVAMGWTVMDLMRREQSEQVPKVLDAMQATLGHAQSMG